MWGILSVLCWGWGCEVFCQFCVGDGDVRYFVSPALGVGT